MPGAQLYAALAAKAVTKIDAKLAPPTAWLNALGMPGFTAYFGLLDVGEAKAGDTVLVSAAAGAVGATVGQVAKQRGCRTVGLAGGPEKCAYLRELGYDVAVDYKAGDLKAALKEACPGGIDVYFDNVGGEILDLALARLNRKARVVICGAISQYNAKEGVTGPKNYLQLLVCRAKMQGFVVFDFAARYPEAVAQLSAWYAEGKLKSKEHVVKGLSTFPETLTMLFKGENFGKLVLECEP
jgi:NADPH-dependent curcumin reductase CurA